MALLLALAFLLAPAVAAVDENGSAVLGVSESAMSPRRTSESYGARVTETSLGNLVADAFRSRSGSKVAVECGGHLIESLPGGEITEAEVYGVFADNLEVGVTELPVSLFFKVLEHAVGQTAIDAAEKIDPESGFDGFPQISGFRLVYDVSQPAGERVRQITLDDGTELAPTDEKTITLAAPADMLSGEMGFDMLQGVECRAVGTEAGLLAAYIAAQPGTLARPDTGRLQAVGTADNSIFRNLKLGQFLPYAILVILLVTLPRQWGRERNMDGTLSECRRLPFNKKHRK